ncbi:phage tail family protein [Clostridium sp. YIM B02505]|uniref:Phage tail family protein n=2 Tax=Clostridium yunnanense TaxID=2800325 RepID=A0ABS1EJC7_9CLOT|nr:phage tail family protein [Clostridium yunnanense]
MKSVFLDKIDKCTLKFSDIDFYYDVVFEGEDKISKINPEALEVGIKFSIYSKYKSQVVEAANRLSTKTINAIGNMKTPVIIEITPSIDLIDITISGLGDNFTIKNLKQGQKIVVNGEDGTVLQGGANKFMDTDMWEFPKLSPGTNSVTFSKNSCDVSIKYKPRWI